jgi:hypothetical protein
MPLDTDTLDQFIKALKSAPKIKIGILDSGKRSGSSETNAEVGMTHEFGTEKVPQRSFLRMPLTEKLAKHIEKSEGFDNDALSEVMAEKSLKPWMKKIAVMAEAVIQEGFDTQGFGKWAPLAPGYENNTGMILQDTQQLRHSITAEVVD